MTKDTTLRLPGGQALDGRSPVVIVGPNGSGKTQLASGLAKSHDAEFVGALRNIQMQDEIPPQPLETATNNFRNVTQRHREHYWQLSNEIDQLFSKLVVEDAASAVRFRDAHNEGTATAPEHTVLQQVRSLWARVFPGRSIKFDGYAPRVRSEHSKKSDPYPASRMSDGERVGLYLAARVLSAPAGILVVDEPEVHFHSRLAVRFWDELESRRPDLRFVYVTHDLPFALSRADARYVLARPRSDPQVLSLGSALPLDVGEALLGAATFSISARRIVFCEGEDKASPDQELLRAWFSGRETVVVPVGSCHQVMRCVSAFRRTSLVAGVEAVGLIDRDYHADALLGALPEGVAALGVHEVESLYCIKGVFLAVASATKHADPDAAFAEFVGKAHATARNDHLLNKTAIERVKARIAPHLEALLADVKSHVDVAQLEKNLVDRLQPQAWSFDPKVVLAEEVARLRTADLVASHDEFLRLFPGKPILDRAAEALGVEADVYRRLANGALSEPESKEPSALRLAVVGAWSQHLPVAVLAAAQPDAAPATP